jgi:hypothetical protein
VGDPVCKALGWILTASIACPLRFAAPFGMAESFSLLDVALVVSVLVLYWSGRRLSVVSTGVFMVLALPALLGILSLVWTQSVGSTLKYVVSVSEAVTAFLVGATVYAGLTPSAGGRRLVAIAWGIGIVGGLSYTGLSWFDPAELFADLRVEGELELFLMSYRMRFSHPFLGLSNNVATILTFLLFLLVGLWTLHKEGTFLAGAILSFVLTLMTLSRGIIVALLLSLVGLWIISRGARASLGYFLVSLSAVVGLVIVLLPRAFYLEDVPRGVTLEEILESRLHMVEGAGRTAKLGVAQIKIAGAPLLGYGGGVAADGDVSLSGGVHNTYVEQVLYYGVPLGLIMGGALLSLPIQVFAMARQARASRGLFLSIAFGLVAELLVFLLHPSFEAHLLRVIVYFLLGAGLAIGRTALAEEEAERLAAETVSTP